LKNCQNLAKQNPVLQVRKIEQGRKSERCIPEKQKQKIKSIKIKTLRA
jgi:hypothetical protein